MVSLCKFNYMRISKLLIVLALFAAFASCNKDHYDVSQAHGVDVEGEVLLPITSKSITMMDMMERFQIDSIISCSDDGSLSFDYFYENYGVVSGEKLLRFNDLKYEGHYEMSNPYVSIVPSFEDTTISFQHTLEFETDHISVLEAMMKSGHLEFNVASNVGVLRRVILSSPDIKDAAGNDFVVDFYLNSDSFGFDLAGLHYKTDVANSLKINFEVECSYAHVLDSQLFIDFSIEGRDLAFSEMRGFVEPYDSRNRIDTTFTLFPDNLSGILEVNDVKLRLSERNTFPLDARLTVDTALVVGEGIPAYSILEPLPLVVELPVRHTFNEVYNSTLNGKINPCGGGAIASSLFRVNASGIEDIITMSDTCNLDVRVNISLPFSFKISDVQYLDTIDLNLTELELPDFIEKLTLELTFTSTLPVNLRSQFYMYDSEHEMITDTLVDAGKQIEASFDGQPTHTTVSIEITEERINKVIHSDRIIMLYELDTDARNVKLTADQKLTLYVKAKAKYNGVAELDN